MIYTTYFAQLKKLPKTITPVSICGAAPDRYFGFEYKTLAPKYDFFRAWKLTHDNDYYIRQFHERVLDRLNADEVVSELRSFIGEGQDIALVCYEKPGDFCHRHLVASWLRENGYPCEEWVPSETVKEVRPMVIRNDLCCSDCSHKEVCSLKEDFQKAQKAVDDCSVSLGKTENGYAMKELRNFDFIERVQLKCKHFYKGGITLRGDGSVDLHY